MSNQNEEILLHFQKCKNLEMHGREGIKFPLQIFILGDVPSSYYTFPLDVSSSNAYAWLELHLIHKWIVVIMPSMWHICSDVIMIEYFI